MLPLKSESPHPVVSIIALLFLASLSMLAGPPAEAAPLDEKQQPRGLQDIPSEVAAVLQENSRFSGIDKPRSRPHPDLSTTHLSNDDQDQPIVDHGILDVAPTWHIYRF
ncbi:hypothetical protein BFW87_00560 [Pseudomonas fluorescens]|uniref:Uncharacterized protein n=1 Tax=Pseudomonas fluorescens TaxID=294 RepID=A0A1T2ZAC4_PSEFL|nr:hypothetical protein [Pseudomonas fluorescens]OPB00934.1 hypothetical protein BFW87_00560 [Pseudomonas fluorescens]